MTCLWENNCIFKIQLYWSTFFAYFCNIWLNGRKLDSHISFCTLLPDVWVELYKENVTSHKDVTNMTNIYKCIYMYEGRSVLIIFTNNYRYSFLMLHTSKLSWQFLKDQWKHNIWNSSMNFSHPATSNCIDWSYTLDLGTW